MTDWAWLFIVFFGAVSGFGLRQLWTWWRIRRWHKQRARDREKYLRDRE